MIGCPRLVKAVVDSGADTRYVNRIVSGVSDAVVQRLLAMALDELGPAPVPSPSSPWAARAAKNRRS